MSLATTRPTGRPLHQKVLIGLVAGALAGFAANALGARSQRAQEVVGWLADGVAHPVGQIFLRLLFLVVVPLVFASLAVGVAGLGDLGRLGRMGGRTLFFFFLTTAVSAVLGLFLMNTFRPGAGFDPAAREALMRQYGAEAAGVAAKAEAQGFDSVLGGVNQVLDMFLPRNVLKAAVDMQMLPLIVLALLFGCALTLAPAEKRERFVAWLETVGEVMVTIVGFAMRLAPYAVFCLIFSVVARFGLELLQKLALYVVLVLTGYIVQLFLFYPLLLRALCRTSPTAFLRKILPVIGTAFSTSSSNATLPTSLRVAQADLGIRPEVAGFVLPLGATMNMNGTALFEGALVLFVAQVFGVELALPQQLFVVLLCVFSAIGAAGVPGGALPLIMIVMSQVGVPPDGIAIVLGVDRLLDLGRRVINVTGALVGAAWSETVESRAAACRGRARLDAGTAALEPGFPGGDLLSSPHPRGESSCASSSASTTGA
jgi:dicarboxylate/amino acid:cation (Na+ or H+) symporter, DAACS family